MIGADPGSRSKGANMPNDTSIPQRGAHDYISGWRGDQSGDAYRVCGAVLGGSDHVCDRRHGHDGDHASIPGYGSARSVHTWSR
jgi:hypothetical protein